MDVSSLSRVAERLLVPVLGLTILAMETGDADRPGVSSRIGRMVCCEFIRVVGETWEFWEVSLVVFVVVVLAVGGPLLSSVPDMGTTEDLD